MNNYSFFQQQFLYFLSLQQRQGLFLPIFNQVFRSIGIPHPLFL